MLKGLGIRGQKSASQKLEHYITQASIKVSATPSGDALSPISSSKGGPDEILRLTSYLKDALDDLYPRFGHFYKPFVFNELQGARCQSFETPF